MDLLEAEKVHSLNSRCCENGVVQAGRRKVLVIWVHLLICC